MDIILTFNHGVVNLRTGVEQDSKEKKRRIWLCKDSKQVATILRKQEPEVLKKI